MVPQSQQQQQMGGIPIMAFAGSAGGEDGDVQLFMSNSNAPIKAPHPHNVLVALFMYAYFLSKPAVTSFIVVVVVLLLLVVVVLVLVPSTSKSISKLG